MKCSDCILYWKDEGNEYSSCHADHHWPAPCEYEEEQENEEYYYEDLGIDW